MFSPDTLLCCRGKDGIEKLGYISIKSFVEVGLKRLSGKGKKSVICEMFTSVILMIGENEGNHLDKK